MNLRNLVQHTTRDISRRLELIANWLNNWHLTRIFQAISSFALIGAIITFAIDLQFRQDEREARIWSIATDPRPGNSGKIPSLEYLLKKGHSLEGIEIPKAYLKGIQLPNADLERANLAGANLSYSNLRGANLQIADLSGANLEGADLTGAILCQANLSDANLYLANFSEAKLWYSNLSGAGLLQANFSKAEMWYANFSNAQLQMANLAGSNLHNAIFINASIEEAIFWDEKNGASTNLSQAQINQAFLWGALPIGLNKVSPIIIFPSDRICKLKGADSAWTREEFLSRCEQIDGFRKVVK